MKITAQKFKPAKVVNDAARWRAVEHRDAQAEFVYAVKSTGVYCRPSCPSRRPRREGVLFFGSPQLAEQGGFRACLRCRPREQSVHGSVILRVCRFIEEHLDEPLDLKRLGEEAKTSPAHLQKFFKRMVGISPREYAAARRFVTFKGRLKLSRSITEALYAAGYNSPSRLYENVAARLGMTPKHYAKGGKGSDIRYALTDSPLGRILVAATERGVCAITLGQIDAALIAALREEFPSARIEMAGDALRGHIRKVVDFVSGTRSQLDLPLDIQATAFQWRVWRALQAIPYGETRSYAEVAREINHPTAVRAVARACAGNPVSLAIPCHRVIRSDGHLGGYRWGLERKVSLLALEKSGAKKK